MSHLSPSELVDLVEGGLPAARTAHANGCEACRAQAAVVRDALQLAAGAPGIPEPSPLFWDHLSVRVREGIAAPPPRPAFAFEWRGFQPILAVLALAVLIFAAPLVTRDSRRAVTRGAVVMAPGLVPGEAGQNADPTLDANHADAWAVLTAAAADLELDEAHAAGMAVPPAAIDRAVQGLNAAELTELGRLLQSELKRSSD